MTTWSTPPDGPSGDPPPHDEGAVVVGLGNVLLGDDGAGPAVCEELRRWQSGARSGRLPARTLLVDGGTLGTGLVPWLVDAEAVVLVDAVDLPGAPGRLRVWRGSSLTRLAAAGGGGLADLVALASLAGLPNERLSLVGVLASEIRPGVGLSRAVSAAVPRAAAMVASEIRRLTGGIG